MAEAALGAVLSLRATRIDAALVGRDGTIRRQTQHRSLAPLTPDAVLETLGALLDHLQAGDGTVVVGAGLALENANVVPATGVVADLAALPGWQNEPVGDMLAHRLGRPAAVESLAGAGLLGERHWGAAQDAPDAIFLETSRSVTVALSVGGARLALPYAGEIGHLPVMAGGMRCGCGGYGHLETVAAAQSLARALIGGLPAAPDTEAAVARLTGGRAEAVTAPQIWQLVCEGDPLATAVMAAGQDALALGIVALWLATGIERIVIGGALAACGTGWRAALAERVAALAPPRRAAGIAGGLRLAAFGPAGAVRGAGALGWAAGELADGNPAREKH